MNNSRLPLISHFSFLTSHLSLLILLTLFTLLTLHQSANLPLGEASDETDHFQYLQFVAHYGHPPLTEAERTEAGYKGGLAPLYYVLTAWPIALVGEETPPMLRRTDQRPERFIPNDGLGFNRVMHTLDEAWPWQGQILAWHLIRLLSLPMAWATLILVYALTWTMFDQATNRQTIALIATMFVAFLPRFIISSAVINDDNLVFALSAAILLTQIHILRGNTRLWALLGTLFGLALITKYFSLILLPEILLTIALSYRCTSARSWGMFILALVVTAGPWFGFIVIHFNRIDELGWIAGLAASLGEPQITNGLVHLLSNSPAISPSTEIRYPLMAWFGLLYRSFWYEYGWMQIFAPTWVYYFYTIIIIIALLGHLNRPKVSLPWPLTHYSLLITHYSLFMVVVIARYILSATLDTGQGRHLYPALPVIALVMGLGISQSRRLTFLLLISYFSLSTWLLLGSGFISNHYQTLPVTHRPVKAMMYPHPITMTDSITLLGYDVPSVATAGEALPVTLYWHADHEPNHDYLLSLCLQDDQARAVGCWAGQFVNGQYPARAWEAEDTIFDTIFIPLPVCYRLAETTYHLHLTVWPLDPTQLPPTRLEPPLLSQTLTAPKITLNSTDLLLTTLPQTVELWQQGQRLTDISPLNLAETITAISYPHHQSTLTQSVAFEWTPTITNPSALPCAEGEATISQYISHAAMPNGLYRLAQRPEIGLNFTSRQRSLSPFTATLTFGNELAPLTWQLNDNPSHPFTPTLDLSIPVLPSDPMNITIQWHTRQWQSEPLVVALKLLDKDFAIGGERVARLGDRYPNVLWQPTELVSETYPLHFNPDALPGLYQLEVSLIHQNHDGYTHLPVMTGTTELGQHLYPVTIRLLDRDHGHPPSRRLPLQLGHFIVAYLGDSTTGNIITFDGYDIQTTNTTVNLALYWRNDGKITKDYTVFTQLIGPDNQVWAQWDNPPQAGRYPTTAWTANDNVIDRYTLTLREGAPAGDYRLLVGMYDSDGQRLPVTVHGQPQPDNALLIRTIHLTP